MPTLAQAEAASSTPAATGSALPGRWHLGSAWLGYGVALGASALALGLALVLDQADIANPFLLFLAAVVVSAWYGGAGPALLATGLGVLAIAYYFEAPAHSLAIASARTVVQLVVFGLVALLISTLHARARAAQQRAETTLAQLQAAEARYRRLFESAADALILVGPDGRYLEANQAASDLLGYSRDELLRLRVGDTAPDPDAARARFAELQRAGELRGETEERRQDGATVPVEWWAVAVTLPTGPVYIHALRDVSARRAAERQQQDFIAMVSHELRNPLTLIKGYAQLLQHHGAADHQAITAIARQATHMESLLGDLLDVARLEAGRLDLHPRPVDLAALASTIAEHLQALTPTHSIQVVAPPQPLVGEWDPQRLTQVFQNLLSNAVKYSPTHGTIEVRLVDRGTVAEVAVADQGQGVPAEALPQLFDRFFRGPGAGTHAPGQGLGLYVAKSLVEAHGGRIQAASPGRGQGTTIVFTLPYRPARAG